MKLQVTDQGMREGHRIKEDNYKTKNIRHWDNQTIYNDFYLCFANFLKPFKRISKSTRAIRCGIGWMGNTIVENNE